MKYHNCNKAILPRPNRNTEPPKSRGRGSKHLGTKFREQMQREQGWHLVSHIYRFTL